MEQLEKLLNLVGVIRSVRSGPFRRKLRHQFAFWHLRDLPPPQTRGKARPIAKKCQGRGLPTGGDRRYAHLAPGHLREAVNRGSLTGTVTNQKRERNERR